MEYDKLTEENPRVGANQGAITFDGNETYTMSTAVLSFYTAMKVVYSVLKLVYSVSNIENSNLCLQLEKVNSMGVTSEEELLELTDCRQ